MRRKPPAARTVLSVLGNFSPIFVYSAQDGISPAVILSSAFRNNPMSTISVHSGGATYLFHSSLNDVNSPVDVVYDRPVAGDDCGIAILIDDACL